MASACVHCYASVTDLDETDSVPTTKICTCEKSNGIQKISKGTETCRHKLQRWRLNTSSTRLVIFPQSRPYILSGCSLTLVLASVWPMLRKEMEILCVKENVDENTPLWIGCLTDEYDICPRNWQPF